MNELVVTDLDVTVGHRRLFRLPELRAQGGDIVALSGPNGAGKTTLLRMLAGLTLPSEGRIHWSQGAAPDLMYLNALPALLLDQPVLENLEWVTNVFGRLVSRKALAEALVNVGLEGREGQVVRSLSTGQKRRLSFAALALVNPDVVLADEPTNGLDAQGRLFCYQEMRRLAARGCLIVTATHDPELLACAKTLIDVEALAKASSGRGQGAEKFQVRLR